MNLGSILEEITDGLEDLVEPDIHAEVNEILRDAFEEVWQDIREVGGLYIYGFDTSVDVDIQETFVFPGVPQTEKVNWKKEGF